MYSNLCTFFQTFSRSDTPDPTAGHRRLESRQTYTTTTTPFWRTYLQSLQGSDTHNFKSSVSQWSAIQKMVCRTRSRDVMNLDSGFSTLRLNKISVSPMHPSNSGEHYIYIYIYIYIHIYIYIVSKHNVARENQ